MWKAGNSDTSFKEPQELTTHVDRPLPVRTVYMRFDYAANTFSEAVLGKTMDRISKLYLVGFHVKTPSSTDPIRVDFDPRHLVAGMDTEGSGAVTTHTAFLINTVANNADTPFAAKPTSDLIARWPNHDGQFTKMGIKLFNGYTNAAITWVNVLLIFEVHQLNWH